MPLSLPARVPLAIGAIFRNEGPYILEWIAHHRLLGIEAIYICDNLSDDGSTELLAALDWAGVITHIPFPVPVASPPCRGQRIFQPADALARVQPQRQALEPRVGVIAGLRARLPRRPALPALDLGPFAVKQRQPGEDVLVAFQVQVIGFCQHFHIIRRVAVGQGVQFSGGAEGAGEVTGQVVQPPAAAGHGVHQPGGVQLGQRFAGVFEGLMFSQY